MRGSWAPTASLACGAGAFFLAAGLQRSDNDANVFDLDILKPALFSTGPNPPYLVRLDLSPDNDIDVYDLDRLKPFLFLGCTP